MWAAVRGSERCFFLKVQICEGWWQELWLPVCNVRSSPLYAEMHPAQLTTKYIANLAYYRCHCTKKHTYTLAGIAWLRLHTSLSLFHSTKALKNPSPTVMWEAVCVYVGVVVCVHVFSVCLWHRLSMTLFGLCLCHLPTCYVCALIYREIDRALC